ncbi:MAG: hypothetical protein ACFFED_00040 [Candidatus Thorarchaeota archaeon]
MPKKKKSSNSKLPVAVLVVALVACAIIILHDGLVGVTPIEDILEFDIIDGFDMDDGTVVTVKGTITSITGDWVVINDGTGSIGFEWDAADDLTEDTVVVVRGVVDTTLLVVRILSDVSSVQPIWLFA